MFYPQTALECSEREWDEQIDVNLKGTFLMTEEVAKAVLFLATDDSSFMTGTRWWWMAVGRRISDEARPPEGDEVFACVIVLIT